MAACPPRSRVLVFGILAVLALVWARPVLAVPFLLPDGEPGTRWQAALALGGGLQLSPIESRIAAEPWVELQRTAAADQWRLRVRDHQGTLHEVTVPVPASERQREELVALAASLLHPMASGSGDFWAGLGASEEPPPLPVEPPPLPLEPPPLPVEPPPLPVEAPPLPVEPPPLPVEPIPEPVAPTPEPPPLPAEPTPPSEPALPPAATGTRIFTRLLGVMDAGLGAPAIAPGGGVQVGVVLPHNLRAGMGFQLEGIRALPHAEQSSERYAELREGDAHLTLLWSPDWPVAPVVAARLGVEVRTVFQASLEDGSYVRRVVSTWTDNGGTDTTSDDVELPITPFPIAGFDLGFSIPAGPGVRLQPFAHLQLDLTYPMALELSDGTLTDLPWYSLHAGLALHLQPNPRSE